MTACRGPEEPQELPAARQPSRDSHLGAPLCRRGLPPTLCGQSLPSCFCGPFAHEVPAPSLSPGPRRGCGHLAPLSSPGVCTASSSPGRSPMGPRSAEQGSWEQRASCWRVTFYTESRQPWWREPSTGRDRRGRADGAGREVRGWGGAAGLGPQNLCQARRLGLSLPWARGGLGV